VPAAPKLARGGGFGVGEALGLSQGHKCTPSFILEVAEGGGRLTIRQPSSAFAVTNGDSEYSDEPPEWGGSGLLKALHGLNGTDLPTPDDDAPRRGRIAEWSDSSRRNFRKFMGGLKLGALDGGMMVGFTYPAEFPAPEDHEIYKGHLRTFEARFLRRYPNGSFVWKLEFQKRGAAHFHCVFFGVGAGQGALDDWKTFADKAWFECVGSGDEKHFKAGVTSEWIRSRGGAVGYLTKYLCKEDQTRPGDFTGRYWGAKGRKNLPTAPLRKEEKTDPEGILIRRAIRKCTESQVKARRKEQLLKKLGIWAEWGASVMDMEAWNAKPGCDRFLPRVTPQWTGPSRLSLPDPDAAGEIGAPSLPFHMPRKFRSKNNLTATLFCNASAVAGQLEKWAADLAGRNLFSMRPGQSERAGPSEPGSGGGVPPAGSREGWNPF